MVSVFEICSAPRGAVLSQPRGTLRLAFPKFSVRGDRRAGKNESLRRMRLPCGRFACESPKGAPFERKEAEGAELTSALIGVSARGAESGGMQPVSTGR